MHFICLTWFSLIWLCYFISPLQIVGSRKVHRPPIINSYSKFAYFLFKILLKIDIIFFLLLWNSVELIMHRSICWRNEPTISYFSTNAWDHANGLNFTTMQFAVTTQFRSSKLSLYQLRCEPSTRYIVHHSEVLFCSEHYEFLVFDRVWMSKFNEFKIKCQHNNRLTLHCAQKEQRILQWKHQINIFHTFRLSMSAHKPFNCLFGWKIKRVILFAVTIKYLLFTIWMFENITECVLIHCIHTQIDRETIFGGRLSSPSIYLLLVLICHFSTRANIQCRGIVVVCANSPATIENVLTCIRFIFIPRK